ncbi:MAG: peptide methionine sulfoxide reductase MsrB [Bacillariaceae sp.]|jgi:peptide methionine sulfoxide reductase MsrB
MCRKFAEYSGYWQSTTFPMDNEDGEPITFYDSGWKGSPLYTAPQDRTWDEFITESKKHGWPSFRDSEVNWDNVRVLPGGEMVSIDGTHLGHNLPDKKGNRYCINLVTIAGNPITDDTRQLL